MAARDIVFALAQSGVCAAFSRGGQFCRREIHYLILCIFFFVDIIVLFAETNQRICFLNVIPDEVIRSLFYNKNNDSLITVSVYASDNFSSLKCRTTRIEYVNNNFYLLHFSVINYFLNGFLLLTRYIRRGQPDAGFGLFESESLKWPGFVEFDDVNGKVLTHSAQDGSV